MAVMIPEKPHHYELASQEGLIFSALEQLADEYYVFHSFRISIVKDDILHENEIDFVIFNRKKGIICLEAKAGRVKYENGYWYYSNGVPMHNGGPFNQADANKWKLKKYFEDKKQTDVLKKCKFLHAVWFPSVTNEMLKNMTLPSEADSQMILTKEALTEPQAYIDKVFDIKLPNGIETDVSETSCKMIIRNILCPQFDVFPTSSLEADLKKTAFHRLLREQAGILNFLGEQKTAVINGAAGTGKTMIAVEKAFRHASEREKVLFLCYNVQLKNHLLEHYENDYIDFYTISGFSCKTCDTKEPDFEKMKEKLDDYYLSETFPYQHVIIDEGQDFGIDDIEEANILQAIKDIIVDNEALNGTFYVFYDRLQLIQARHSPQFIENADCKLTLYRNCRNTENIAITSLKPICERMPKLIEGCVKGAPARMFFCTSKERAREQLELILETLHSEGYKEIAILTCDTEQNSIFAEYVKDGKYNNTIFTTCRKFKGLEADAVILVDVNRKTFSKENVMLYYVGASRARIQLDVITTLTDEECMDVLQMCLNKKGKIKRAQRNLSSALNAIGYIVE